MSYNTEMQENNAELEEILATVNDLPDASEAVPADVMTGATDTMAGADGANGSGATGDYIPVPATAEVGQTIRVSAVDDTGKPTAWEAVELPTDWEVIYESVIAEDVSGLKITTDSAGESFALDEVNVLIRIPYLEGRGSGTLYFSVSGDGYGNISVNSQEWLIQLEYSRRSGYGFCHYYEYGTTQKPVKPFPNGVDDSGFRKKLPATMLHIDGTLSTGTTVQIFGRRYAV